MMPKFDDRIGLAAVTTVPVVGRRQRESDESGRRAPLLELLVVGLMVLLVVPTLILTARSHVSAQQAQATLSISSDPMGASVIVDNLLVGTTPMQLELQKGETVALRVEAKEPYLEYHLYKPYRSELSLESDRNIHVWIPRTTTEEQAAELAANR